MSDHIINVEELRSMLSPHDRTRKVIIETGTESVRELVALKSNIELAAKLGEQLGENKYNNADEREADIKKLLEVLALVAEAEWKEQSLSEMLTPERAEYAIERLRLNPAGNVVIEAFLN